MNPMTEIKLPNKMSYVQLFERTLDLPYRKTIDIDTVLIQIISKGVYREVSFFDYKMQPNGDLNSCDLTQLNALTMQIQTVIALNSGLQFFIVYHTVDDPHADVPKIQLIRVYDYLLEKWYPIWTKEEYNLFLLGLYKTPTKTYDVLYKEKWKGHGWC